MSRTPPKIEIDHFPSENKWEPHASHFTPNNASNFTNSPLTAASLSISPTIEKNIGASLSFDSQHSDKDRESLVKDISHLLADDKINAQIELSEFNDNEFTVTLNDASPGDLAKMVGALSVSRDFEHGKTAFNVIDPSLINAICDAEIKALKEYNVPEETAAYEIIETNIDREGQSNQYFDYQSNVAGSPIDYLREDSMFYGENDLEKSVHTEIYLGDSVSQKEILELMKNENIIAHKTGETVHAQADLKVISKILAKNDLIPQSASDKVNNISVSEDLRLSPVFEDAALFNKPQEKTPSSPAPTHGSP